MTIKANNTELFQATSGDFQSVKRIWETNRKVLTAKVFNPFGILPEKVLEFRAVLLFLKELEQFCK